MILSKSVLYNDLYFGSVRYKHLLASIHHGHQLVYLYRNDAKYSA